MAKKDFEWDSQREIGTVEINANHRKVVYFCTLKDTVYVSVTTVKVYKDQWQPTGGFAIPIDKWNELKDIVNDGLLIMTKEAKAALDSVKKKPSAKDVLARLKKKASK